MSFAKRLAGERKKLTTMVGGCYFDLKSFLAAWFMAVLTFVSAIFPKHCTKVSGSSFLNLQRFETGCGRQRRHFKCITAPDAWFAIPGPLILPPSPSSGSLMLIKLSLMAMTKIVIIRMINEPDVWPMLLELINGGQPFAFSLSLSLFCFRLSVSI